MIPVSKAISVRGGGVGCRHDPSEHVGTIWMGSFIRIFTWEESLIFVRTVQVGCDYSGIITTDKHGLHLETNINNDNWLASRGINIILWPKLLLT